jgi:hypothetical protein
VATVIIALLLQRKSQIFGIEELIGDMKNRKLYKILVLVLKNVLNKKINKLIKLCLLEK